MKITIDTYVISDKSLAALHEQVQQLILLRIADRRDADECVALANLSSELSTALDARNAIAHFENYDADELRVVL